MPALHPILATERTAAQLLDMKPAEFRRLVEQGALPTPVLFRGRYGRVLATRWGRAEIQCIQFGIAHLREVDEDWDDVLARFLGDVAPSRYIPITLRAEVYTRDGGTCRYCGDDGGPFHMDHVFPLSRGGGTSLDNLALACADCNMAKGARTPEEWMEAKSWRLHN